MLSKRPWFFSVLAGTSDSKNPNSNYNTTAVIKKMTFESTNWVYGVIKQLFLNFCSPDSNKLHFWVGAVYWEWVGNFGVKKKLFYCSTDFYLSDGINSSNFAELSVRRAMTMANISNFESKKKAITQELYLFTR